MEHSILEISIGIILIFLLICLACTVVMCYIYKLDFLKEYLRNLGIGLGVVFFLGSIILILFKFIL